MSDVVPLPSVIDENKVAKVTEGSPLRKFSRRRRRRRRRDV